PTINLDDPTKAEPLFTSSGVSSLTYELSVTDLETGCVMTDEVEVTVNSKPTLVITNPSEVCAPNTVDITSSDVTEGSSVGLTYTYYTEIDPITVHLNPSTVSESGTYYIKGVNVDGCESIAPVEIVINSKPILVITNPLSVCSPSTVSLTLPDITDGSS